MMMTKTNIARAIEVALDPIVNLFVGLGLRFDVVNDVE